MEEQLKIDFDKVVKGLKLSDENIKFRKKSLDEFTPLLDISFCKLVFATSLSA